MRPAGEQARGGRLDHRFFTRVSPFVDALAAVLGLVAAVGGLGELEHLPTDEQPLLAMPALTVLFLYLRCLYRMRLHTVMLDRVGRAVSAVAIAAMTVAGLTTLKVNGDVVHGVPLMRAWLFVTAAVVAGRVVLGVVHKIARASGVASEPVLIVGAGEVGQLLAKRLIRYPDDGLWPVGFLDDDRSFSSIEVGNSSIPVLGRTRDMCLVARQTGVRRVIVAFARTPDSVVSTIVREGHRASLEVSVVPRMFDAINDRSSYDTVAGIPMVSFAKPNTHGFQITIKHTFDVAAAALFLFIAAPILAAFAVAVKLSSPGPVLFRQRRIGRDGHAFELYKFRSMRIAEDRAPVGSFGPADEASAPGGVEGDDRRTRLGVFMRRTSLDELPQLFHVLKGDMSFVGPRPERPEYVDRFKHDVRRYSERHRVKPGLTGWAQIHGLRGQTSLEDRVDWDNYYIEHWTLWMDLNILLRTPFALFHSTE
jgi:exopolysaccharide biosynthesis polyprenyl glycosylphosphotransferase